MLRQPKIGLALGSGGPRGLAHVGIIKVLVENNIPIDFIAGSSMGAMIGAFYAAKKDIQQVEELTLATNLKLIFSLIDPAFQQGLLRGEKVHAFIESYMQGVSFEDLKIPLSVVATNLKNGEAVVMNEGNVTSAVRASISLPLVFKPVEREGALLADGGLSLPVPVEVVRNMGAEFIIAVNLDADYFGNGDDESTTFGFYKVGENSISILRHHLARWDVQSADIVINPLVGHAGWDNFLDSKNTIAAGEDAARKMLPQIKEMLSA